MSWRAEEGARPRRVTDDEAQRFGPLTVLHPAPNAHARTSAARAVYHATGIARPALSVTARWASAGRGAGAPTSTAIAGEAAIAANALGDEVDAFLKHAAAATVPTSGAAAGLRGLDGSGAPAAAAGAASAGAAAPAPPAAAASGAPAGSAALQLYVQREGDPRFMKLLSTALDVDDLTEEVAQKLKLEAPLSTVTLHVAQVDEDTGAVLRVEEAALPSRKALAALPALQCGASIVVKVAAAPAAGAWPREVRRRAAA